MQVEIRKYRMLPIASRLSKDQYSAREVAEELGVSAEQLRSLIRSHIVETDEDLNNVAIASFHPSDLLVLKLLSNPAPTTPG
jgi:hypothetical protein